MFYKWKTKKERKKKTTAAHETLRLVCEVTSVSKSKALGDLESIGQKHNTAFWPGNFGLLSRKLLSVEKTRKVSLDPTNRRLPRNRMCPKDENNSWPIETFNFQTASVFQWQHFNFPKTNRKQIASTELKKKKRKKSQQNNNYGS